MVTITKVPASARFFTNMCNARRALKKIYACSTEQANELIHIEAPEDGGRYWFDEKVVNALANPQVEADKATIVDINLITSKPAACKVRSITQNGVRRPIKGLCADVWQALDDLLANELPTIKHVRDLAQANNWNLNNATIEFYGWRKFHGLNNKKAK